MFVFCILPFILLSVELVSAYPWGDTCWLFLLGGLWVVVLLGGASMCFDHGASSGLRSLLWDRGCEAIGECWGELRCALGLYYLYMRLRHGASGFSVSPYIWMRVVELLLDPLMIRMGR